MWPGIGTPITPLLYRIVNAISSGVALLAAKMMSPSFSGLVVDDDRLARQRCRRSPARRVDRILSCWLMYQPTSWVSAGFAAGVSPGGAPQVTNPATHGRRP